MSSRVESYLNERKSSGGTLANEWLEFESLYQSRLWHELTLRVQLFVHRDELQQGDQLIKFYENFLSDFEHRINQLALVEIIIPITRTFKQVDQAIQFVQQIREKVKANSLAILLCDITIGKAYLITKNLPETKKIIEDLAPKFDELDHLTTVHSRYYDLASNYYRVMGNHSEYYQNALKYLGKLNFSTKISLKFIFLLGCIDNSSIPVKEKAERAFNLGLAALLAENVYNFGEILQHPVLDALKDTREQWLIDLLQSFNIGDVEKYETLKSIWQVQPDLRMAEPILQRKINLLCLMDMIFAAGGTRALNFNDVAKRTKLSNDQVELLAMQALSLGLIRGSIDQVDEKLNMHWVKPRVLDLRQVSTLKKRLDQWTNDVKQMSTLVEQQAGDILS
jgi:26S proteasome regulatory subunit N9